MLIMIFFTMEKYEMVNFSTFAMSQKLSVLINECNFPDFYRLKYLSKNHETL
jgi:hypothetical protein